MLWPTQIAYLASKNNIFLNERIEQLHSIPFVALCPAMKLCVLYHPDKTVLYPCHLITTAGKLVTTSSLSVLTQVVNHFHYSWVVFSIQPAGLHVFSNLKLDINVLSKEVMQ